MKRIRKPRSSNSEAQLAALREKQIPKPSDAEAGAKPKVVSLSFYPEALADLNRLELAAGATSKSQVARLALAFAAAHEEEFLKEFGVKLG
jgi:hypothetical protein